MMGATCKCLYLMYVFVGLEKGHVTHKAKKQGGKWILIS